MVGEYGTGAKIKESFDVLRKEETMEQKTFVVAVNRFFGRLPEQTMQYFKEELNQLTKNDRAELKEFHLIP